MTTETKPRHAGLSPLYDEDSAAYQVQTFLDSVMPLRGNNICEEYFAGYRLVSNFVMHLVVEGDQAHPPLTPQEVAEVLGFLSLIETRPGKEDHAAGGSSMCGLITVLNWLRSQVQTFQPGVQS